MIGTHELSHAQRPKVSHQCDINGLAVRVAGATGLPFACDFKECDKNFGSARPEKTLSAPLALSHFSAAIFAVLILLVATAPGWGQALCVPDGKPLTTERVVEASNLLAAIASSRKALGTLKGQMERSGGGGRINITAYEGLAPGCPMGCILYSQPTKELGPLIAPLIKRRIADLECRLSVFGVVLP